MNRYRVISFIDGFNLYHAISNLRRPELKWVDLETALLHNDLAT